MYSAYKSCHYFWLNEYLIWGMMDFSVIILFLENLEIMGSCSSIDENKVGQPVKTKQAVAESSNLINTYPSIEDVIRQEKLKKKKNSRAYSQDKINTPKKQSNKA